MQKPNPLFVKIEEPLALRKSLVESAIGSIALQKEYEKLKLTEQQISTLTSRFLGLLKQIERNIDILSSLMPQVRLPGEQQMSQPRYVIKEQYPASKQEREISSLEQELKDIESQLTSITI